MPGKTHVMRCRAFGNGAIFLEPGQPLTMGDFFLGLDQQFTSCDGMGKSALNRFCHLVMLGINANGKIRQRIGSGDYYLHFSPAGIRSTLPSAEPRTALARSEMPESVEDPGCRRNRPPTSQLLRARRDRPRR